MGGEGVGSWSNSASFEEDGGDGIVFVFPASGGSLNETGGGCKPVCSYPGFRKVCMDPPRRLERHI